LAPSGAGLLKVKVFWRQKARVVLRLKISGMISGIKYLVCKTNFSAYKCGNIGFLPNGLWHVGIKVYVQLIQTCFEGHQDEASCCWVCHGRFHGILPKEYSGTFYEVCSMEII
jgi:hypothetical protein